MDLRSIVRLLLGSWKSIVVITLLAGVTGWYLSPREPARYLTSVTLAVSSWDTPDDTLTAYQRNLLVQQQTKSYAVLLRSERVMQAVADELHLDPPPAGQITAAAPPDTPVINITVTDTSPQRAQVIANSAAAQFIRLLPELVTPPTGKAPAVSVRVVNPAALPSVRINPPPSKDVPAALALGLFCGVGLAFVRQQLDNTVKLADELTALAGAPLLGTVAADRKARQAPLAIQQGPHSSRAEAFRKIRTAMQFAHADRAHQVVLVASAVSGEGRTVTACNLAIALAQSGERVLLVDADLRRPRVAGYLGLHNGVGLTSVLAGSAKVAEAVQDWGDNLMSVLTSGPIPPNPGEILGRRQMRELIERLRGEYDFVLIDTAPVLPAADAAATAVACDGVVVVARYGKTSRDQVSETVSALRGVGAEILGTVLNLAPASAGQAYHHQYSALPEPADPQPMPAGSPRGNPAGRRRNPVSQRARRKAQGKVHS